LRLEIGCYGNVPQQAMDYHLTHDSLQGPSEPMQNNSNGVLIGSAVFAQMSRDCPYTFQWDASFCPSKVPLPIEGSGPHLIHGSWAHQSPQPKRHLDRFSRFCRVH